MEVVNVHVGVQTASLSMCFLKPLSYVTINHETVSFVVEIKLISYLCEIFSFHTGEYEDFCCLESSFMYSADNHRRLQETYYLLFHRHLGRTVQKIIILYLSRFSKGVCFSERTWQIYMKHFFSLLYCACCQVTQLFYQPLHIYKFIKFTP